MRLRPSVVLALLAILAAPLVAWARPAERVLPGQKVFGEINANDRRTILVDCVAGTTLGAKCTAFRGTTPRLDLALAEPDGTPIVLGKAKTSNAKQTAVSFKGVKTKRTGSYRVTVTTGPSNAGGFDLTITGSMPASVSGDGLVRDASAVETIPVDAVAGDKVTLVVRPAKGSKLKPLIRRFIDAGGAETAVGTAKQKKPIPISTLGTSSFEVAGADGTMGAFKWTLKFVRAKSARTRRDAATLNAVGTITGTVIVDGQAPPRDTSTHVEKAARVVAPDVVAGELVIAMPEAKSYAEVEAAADAAMPGTHCTVLHSLTDTGPYLVSVDYLAAWGEGARAKSATRALAKSATTSRAFDYCTPNAIDQPCVDATDPLYAQQYNMKQLKLPEAWNTTTGTAAIVVAVVDTGKLAHPDLDAAYLPGYDFVTDASNAMDGDGWDSDATDAAIHRHGTHCAGLVGARANNGVGVAGAAWNVRLLPVRVLGKNGGSHFDIAAGVRWAVGLPVTGVPTNPNPARVLSMSLGSQSYDATMQAAIAGAITQTKAVVVAGAGNDGSSTPFYPAAYPGVICVYALDMNLKYTSYTNYGSWIHVGAPGGDQSRGLPGILSTYATAAGSPNYAQLDGTSMATPQVAGVAALLLSVAPQLDAAAVKDILQKTATDLGPAGFDNDYGWGMVDARAAIASLSGSQGQDAVEAAPNALTFDAATGQSGFVVRSQAGNAVALAGVQVTTDPGSGWMTATPDHMTTPAKIAVTISPTLGPGAYTGHVLVATALGNLDVPITVVRNPPAGLTFATIHATDENGYVVATATATAATNWKYTLRDVPLGRHRITTLIDIDGTQQIDRVDELEGEWPLRSQPQLLPVSPESLDSTNVNLPLERFDTRFDYQGVGAGRISGALAVRACDARSGVPIAGAGVHIGGGTPVAYTDARGRALVVGGFNGGQLVTVIAPGYGPMTHANQDAQFESFPLEPPTPVPTTTVTAQIRGISSFDKEVWVQIGDARAHAVYDGVNALNIPLTFTTSAEATPISATAYGFDGAPTRQTTYEVLAPTGGFDVNLLPIQPGQGRTRDVQANVPATNFSGGGGPVGTMFLRWHDAKWLSLGETALAFGQLRTAWFVDPLAPDPVLPMKFEVAATDASGRTTRIAYYGTTKDHPVPPTVFTLDAPAAHTAPAPGAVGVAAAPLLSWTPVAGAQLHKVVIEKVGSSWRWTIWLPATANQVQLPSPATGGLAAATDYRWSVESFRIGGAAFTPHAYLDEQLDALAASRVFSGWATLRTQ